MSFLSLLIFNHITAEPIMQSGSIHGIVMDSQTHMPLTGVNVMITNSNIGIASDNNGKFLLHRIKSGNNSLTLSMIGYKTCVVPVTIEHGKRNEIKVEMEKTLLEMGSIVVTGTGTPHLIEDSPVKTTLVTRLDIEQKKSANVAEALDFQPGINVENNCQNCNFSQVRILGMDGKYSQILIDGDPVVSSLAGVYGLEHYPAEMLDRLEITKGGGSSLYGGGAVAGVINLITRRPKINQSRVKYSHGITNQSTNDSHLSVSSEMVSNSGKSGAYIFASTRNREHYDINDDSYSEQGDLKNESLGFNWFYTPIENGELSTRFHRIHEVRRGGNKFSLPYHDADIAEALEHWKWGGTVKWNHQINPLLDYKVFYSFAITDRKSYYGGLGGGTSREDSLAALGAYGTTENPLQITGITANYLLGTHLITTGLQYSEDKVNDKSTSNELYYIYEKFTNVGYFLQDNMHLGKNEDIELVLGARFDKHSELDNIIISPRINLKMDITDEYVFRAGFSTGFKAPQTYDEDLHICGLEGGQKVIRNANDLKEEKSYSYTTGIDYNGFLGNLGVMVGITAYYTTINDVFSEKFVKSDGKIDLWERINSSGADVKGIELEAGLQPNSKIEIIGGLTYSEGLYKDELEDWNTKKFLRTPKISGNLAINATIIKNLSINARAKYMGEAFMPHEIVVDGQEEPLLKLEKSSSFFQSDLMFNYKLAFLQDINSKITFGFKNIFDVYQEDLDEGPDRDPAYVYGPAMPRTLFFNIETIF
jgi:outer membrane receptor for ferrienterochelin and colicins